MPRTELRSSGRAVCVTGESLLSPDLVLFIIYLCVLPWHTCWGQRTTGAATSFLLPCGTQGSKSGGHTLWTSSFTSSAILLVPKRSASKFSFNYVVLYLCLDIREGFLPKEGREKGGSLASEAVVPVHRAVELI